MEQVHRFCVRVAEVIDTGSSNLEDGHSFKNLESAKKLHSLKAELDCFLETNRVAENDDLFLSREKTGLLLTSGFAFFK